MRRIVGDKFAELRKMTYLCPQNLRPMKRLWTLMLLGPLAMTAMAKDKDEEEKEEDDKEEKQDKKESINP